MCASIRPHERYPQLDDIRNQELVMANSISDKERALSAKERTASGKQRAPSASTESRTLSDKERGLIDSYWRATNYLSVGQIYLYDNPLLKQPLTKEHIKPRLLGHWGTTPGLNFIYVHLNRIIKKHDL